jgi:mRNA-degrading endonuclease toxin of MazEF toxin-antitoxin module
VPRIRQGDIFWLDNCLPLHGDAAKRRPVVVISPNETIETSVELLSVACTSSAYPSDSKAVELPSRERTPQTKSGLQRRTWAVPEWLLPVERKLLTDRIGYVSGATLRKLLDAFGVRRALNPHSATHESDKWYGASCCYSLCQNLPAARLRE